MKSDDSMQQWFINNSNPTNFKGTISEAIIGADIFIGVSAPNVLTEADVASMAKGAIVFALANPDPEIDPVIARKYATVVATGRSDQPNQINNVLAFPGLFKGALQSRAENITEEMKLCAAKAIAGIIQDDELNRDYIIPSPFDKRVVEAVSSAVIQEFKKDR